MKNKLTPAQEINIRKILFRYVQKCSASYSGKDNPSDEIMEYLADELTAQNNKLVKQVEEVLLNKSFYNPGTTKWLKLSQKEVEEVLSAIKQPKEEL